MMADVAAIVLAAGESSRMGRPKPLLPLNGSTFLGHLLDEIRASRASRKKGGYMENQPITKFTNQPAGLS